MKASLLAILNDAERLLVAETEPKALATLDEDAVGELHARVRRARDKYVGQYRRTASAAVGAKGGRGRARPENRRAAQKAEAFEEALARASRRLAVLASRAAAELRAERLAAAGAGSAAATRSAPARTTKQSTRAKPAAGPRSTASGDRALRSPAREKARASTRAVGDRRQARKDRRTSG
jgi:hypothetical protein